MKFFFILFIILGETLQGASFQSVSDVQQKIEDEIKNLNQVQENIHSQYSPLMNQMNALNQEISELRKEIERESKKQIQKERQYSELESETIILEKEAMRTNELLSEFKKNFTSNLNPSEEKSYLYDLKNINDISKLNHFFNFFSNRLPHLFGGHLFKGNCVGKAGQYLEGQFFSFGPFLLFKSTQGDLSGLVGLDTHSFASKVIYDLPPDLLQKLYDGKSALIPLDLKDGKVLKIESQKGSLWDHVLSGGYIVYPILFLAFICLLVSILKTIHLMKINVHHQQEKLSEVIHWVNQGKIKEAVEKVRALGRPFGPVLYEGIHHRKASREHLEEIMHEQILSQLPFLEKNLAILSVSAAAAPLLGLLGTVTGMIHTFQMVTTFGSGKVQMLSSGISEALITTEFGLMLAIPALLIHAFLSKRVKLIVQKLEQLSLSFMNGINVIEGAHGYE